MGFFSLSTPFDADVEKATNENNTSEQWTVIMDICDRVGSSTTASKDCLRSIVKRLNAQDPHIVVQAITLLDACVSNCGKPFHLEIASREFEGELKKLIASRSQPQIAEKTKALLKKWAEGEFKTDPQLNLIPSFYTKLKQEGVEFSTVSETPKHSTPLPRDPNVVTSNQEEADIAKAIELSLKETQQQQSVSSHSSPSSKKSSSLYPSMSSLGSSSSEGRKVRALYNFEAAEDNELTFLAGEIIHIIDDSDPNWWKGSNHRGEGLFPSNFVTADLSAEPEQYTKLDQGSKKSVQFAEEVEVRTVKSREPEIIEVEIDEKKMDRLLHLFHEADPQCDSADPREMLDLEEQVTAMGPLIDAALEKVDKRHAQLTQLSSDLVDALNLYHTLMREPPPPSPANYTLPKMPPSHIATPYSYPTHAGQLPSQQPPQSIYNGMPSQHPPYSMGNVQAGPYPGSTMPPSDYIPGSVPLAQHYPMMPPGTPQQYPPRPQGLQQTEQTSLPYQTQGLPMQGGSASGPYGPTSVPINQPPQHTQYAPQNGQHMM